MEVTQEFAARVVDIDPKTGRMYWAERPMTDFKSKGSYWSYHLKLQGKEVCPSHYTIKLYGKRYYKTKFAWYIYYGETFDQLEYNIWCLNGDRHDVRKENLIKLSKAEGNRVKYALRVRGQTHMPPGVSWDEKKQFYYVYYTDLNSVDHYKSFKTFDEALRFRHERELEVGYQKIGVWKDRRDYYHRKLENELD